MSEETYFQPLETLAYSTYRMVKMSHLVTTAVKDDVQRHVTAENSAGNDNADNSHADNSHVDNSHVDNSQSRES